MRIQIASWDGQSLNNDDFATTVIIGAGNGATSAMPNFVDVGNNYPVLTSKTTQGAQYTIRVRLLGVTDAAREVQRDALFAMFDPYDFDVKTLIGEDYDDGDAQWYLTGFVISPPMLVEQTIADYSVSIALELPYWQKVNTETTSFNIGSTTEDNEVDPGGNVPVPPVISITPQAPKGDPLDANRFFVGIHPPADNTSWGIGSRRYYYQRPVDLTPDGLDTEALVLDGKMRSDGNDVKVIIDGVQVPRFFGGGAKGMNSPTTHIWAYVTMPFYTELKLVTPLDGTTTPSSIVFDSYDTRQEDNFEKVPADLLIGTEIITYTAITKVYYPANTGTNIRWRYTVTGIKRGAKGSTKAAHSAGILIDRFHQDIWIVYGDPNASAPDPKTDWIPSFDLEQSTNDAWVYDGQFTATGATGTQGFTRAPVMNGPGKLYTKAGNVGVGDVNNVVPWEVTGLKRASTLLGNLVYNETSNRCMWKFWHDSCPLDSVEYVGRHKRTGINSADIWLCYSLKGQPTLAVAISAPAVIDTWEDFSGTIDLSSFNTYEFEFLAKGTLGTSIPAPTHLAELSYLKMNLALTPVVFTPSTENASYQQAGYIMNVENNHIIAFKNIPMLTGQTLTIDCVEMTATISDGRDARGYLEFTGVVRDEWMLMLDGSNTIRYYDLDATDVDVSITTRPRNTI